LNFQVSLPAPAFDRKYRKRQIRRACEAVAVRAGRSSTGRSILWRLKEPI
jgi:hypothetical protein